MGTDGTNPAHSDLLALVKGDGADIRKAEVIHVTPGMNVRLGLVIDDNAGLINENDLTQKTGVSTKSLQSCSTKAAALQQLCRRECVFEEYLSVHQ